MVLELRGMRRAQSLRSTAVYSSIGSREERRRRPRYQAFLLCLYNWEMVKYVLYSELNADLKSSQTGKLYLLCSWSYLDRWGWRQLTLLNNIFADAVIVIIIIIIMCNPLPSHWNNVLTYQPDQNHFWCPKVIRRQLRGRCPLHLECFPSWNRKTLGLHLRYESDWDSRSALLRGKKRRQGWVAGHSFLPFWQNVTFILTTLSDAWNSHVFTKYFSI